MSSSDASLRRLSCLVSRYLHLGSHLQKCRELLPYASRDLTQMNVALTITHQEMKGFEEALATLIEDAMVLHEDLRQTKFHKRRAAVAITCSEDSKRSSGSS
jgi:hypothetical protein